MLKKILSSALIGAILAPMLVLAQTALTVEQPIFDEKIRYAQWESQNAHRTTIGGLAAGFASQDVQVIQIPGAETLTEIRLKTALWEDKDNFNYSATMAITMTCQALDGTICPPETNRIGTDGYVIFNNGGNYAPFVTSTTNANIVAGTSASFDDSAKDTTYPISTLHVFTDTNVYTVNAIYRAVNTAHFYAGQLNFNVFGTNSNLTPLEGDIENAPLWQQILLGLAINLDSLTGAGFEQYFSSMTGIFFKPFFQADISTSLSFGTIAATYYQPDTGGSGGFSSVAFTSCEALEAQSCSLTDVKCGVQKGICSLFIGDLDSNFTDFTDNLEEIREERLPMAYFFKIKDAWDDSSADPSFVLAYSPNQLGLLDGTVMENTTFTFADLGNLNFTTSQQTVLDYFETILKYFLVISILVFVMRSVKI